MFWYYGRWGDRLSSTSSVEAFQLGYHRKFYFTDHTRLGLEPTSLGWHNSVNETLLYLTELGKDLNQPGIKMHLNTNLIILLSSFFGTA